MLGLNKIGVESDSKSFFTLLRDELILTSSDCPDPIRRTVRNFVHVCISSSDLNDFPGVQFPPGVIWSDEVSCFRRLLIFRHLVVSKYEDSGNSCFEGKASTSPIHFPPQKSVDLDLLLHAGLV